jgi:AhpD family alkylhydroperoxidase
MKTAAPRLEYTEFRSLAEGVAQGLTAANASSNAALPLELLELVRQRASLENGCDFCLVLHADRLSRAGVSEERIGALASWRDASCYSERERAALALSDAMTRLGPEGVPDSIFQAASQHFPARELSALVSAIAVINAWNRIAVTLRFSPESARQR